jgi:cell division protein ZapB
MSDHQNEVSSRISDPQPPKNNNILKIGMALAILAIALLVYFVQREQQQNMLKEAALTAAFLQLDSLSNELDERILTISQLGGEIDTLVGIKQKLEEEKMYFLNKDQRQKITLGTLRGKVEGYRQLLLIKDEEINQLTQINGQLTTENIELKNETQVLNQSINDIKLEKNDLNQKVQLLSKLKIEDFVIAAVDVRGKERLAIFRKKHISQLKITFVLSENEVAPIEGKKLWIRVIAPDNNVYYDVNMGSGSFTFLNRELFYTAQKEILYDRSQQSVIVYYEKGTPFLIGPHNIEVYTDDYLIGSGSFIVKS